LPERLRIVQLSPKHVLVPDVRVTAAWDPELLEMFKRSIRDMGIQAPIVCVEEDGKFWLVDGLHRLDEAKLNNQRSISVAVVSGTMRDVLLKNLVINRLRGKTPPTQMAKVVSELHHKYKMGFAQIAKETGLRQDYVEKMVQVCSATPEVLEALDREEIPVGVAWEISRVPDRAVQGRLLAQARHFRIKVDDMRDIVEETLRILAEKRKEPEKPLPTEAPKPPTAKCQFCGQEHLIAQVAGAVLCRRCFGIAYDHIQELLAKRQHYDREAREAAEKAVEGPATQGSGS